MKKALLIILLSAILLIGCSNSKNLLYIYDINEDVHSFKIEWYFGKINFINSDKMRIQETTTAKENKKLKYSIDDGTLTIKNLENESKDLEIHLNKNFKYEDLIIYGYNVDLNISKMDINNIILKTKIGKLSIYQSNINKLTSSFVSRNIDTENDNNISSIIESKINDCQILVERDSTININNNTFDKFELSLNSSNINFKRNKFNTATFLQQNGNTYMELNGNLGYTFQIYCKHYSLDMETIQYNDKFFYKNGDHKLIYKNLYGSLDIRRYFE